MSDAAAVPLVLPRSFVAKPAQPKAVKADVLADWIGARLSLAGREERTRLAVRSGKRAESRARKLAKLSSAALDRLREQTALRLRRNGVDEAGIVEALALASQFASRHITLTPFRQQLAGASALLRAEAVEMDTGEGKTLTAFLAASAYALAGRHVHVVTANDYLAGRDAEFLRPALEAMGLTTGTVTGGDSPEQRRRAHACDVVFLSNKEAAFDYLRDGLARAGTPGNANLSAKLGLVFGAASGQGQPIQRRLDVAIVDEIDSVLVDDAGTPLLISASSETDIDVPTAELALKLAAKYRRDADFIIDPHSSVPALTARGLARLEEETRNLGGDWKVRLKRNEMMRAALSAQHTLIRDRHYLVREGKIVLVDQYSGRAMPDRHWSLGLNLMVEVKEGCASTGIRKSLASISFQRFFRGYATICGMSGTVSEVAREIHEVYGLPLTPVPRRLRLRRTHRRRRFFGSRERLWTAAARAVAKFHMRGQPVLVAVRSVAEAQRASLALQAWKVPHEVLSAAQDDTEAEIVARAGLRAAVTIATNMAGRGTDIRLGAGVAKLGGLVVMICERHDSARVDRQLMGRCARQGDPGLVLEYVSGEDDALRSLGPMWRALVRLAPGAAFARAQHISENKSAKARIALLRRDEQLARIMAFAGGLD